MEEDEVESSAMDKCGERGTVCGGRGCRCRSGSRCEVSGHEHEAGSHLRASIFALKLEGRSR